MGPLLVALLLVVMPAFPLEAEQGTATWYAGKFVGRPLYCSDRDGNGPMHYSQYNQVPWVALDESWYLSGRVECGDPVWILFEDHAVKAYAYDAGYLNGYYVEDYGPDNPILVDFPKSLWPDHPNRSALVTVVIKRR